MQGDGSPPRALRAVLQEGERTQFLLDVSRLLLESLEYEVTLSRLARLATSRVVDLCVIELAGDDGTSTAVEVAHEDPVTRGQIMNLYRQGAPAQGAFTELGIDSVMVLPMKAKERTLGVLTLGTASPRSFGADDLAMAEQLADFTALAVASAREYLVAKNAVRTREDLLGIVSHDLRNPLNVTLMKCAMMLRDSSGSAGNERLRRDVEAIERATRRMDRLLKDLQDFSSIQTGHLAIERRPELAMDLVNEAAESARTLAAKRGIDVDVDGIADDLQITCDRERVLQVCSNLVGNALKFTPESGKVVLTARVDGEGLVFSVRDTGVGIDPDELPHVFQKYWRARNGRRGGVGLGLFISRALVMEHGGRIWGESEKGLGSTFSFSLPLGPASARVEARRILIVDDDVDLRRELGEVLATEGWPVAFAADGRQALSYLQNHPRPALVLVDLMMPVMDGWEFCATVSAEPEFSHVPVVVLSCLERHEANGGALGVAGYLRKPVQLQELLDVVSSVVPAGTRSAE